jgi:hypothetical protein
MCLEYVTAEPHLDVTKQMEITVLNNAVKMANQRKYVPVIRAG